MEPLNHGALYAAKYAWARARPGSHLFLRATTSDDFVCEFCEARWEGDLLGFCDGNKPKKETAMENPEEANSRDVFIMQTKAARKALDECRVALKNSARQSRQRSIAMTKITEAVMWLGMDMRDLHDGKTCYPEGKNPDNVIVEPVPDGVHG